jgi:hypothetical protein
MSGVDDSMSMAELKAHAAGLGITNPDGHKGYKKTWISAIQGAKGAGNETPVKKPISGAAAPKKLFDDIEEGDTVHVTSGKYASSGVYVVYSVGSHSCKLELPDGNVSGNVKKSSLTAVRKGLPTEPYSGDECEYILRASKRLYAGLPLFFSSVHPHPHVRCASLLNYSGRATFVGRCPGYWRESGPNQRGYQGSQTGERRVSQAACPQSQLPW